MGLFIAGGFVVLLVAGAIIQWRRRGGEDMGTYGPVFRSLAIGLAAVILGGCGAQSAASLPQGVGAQSRAHEASGSSGDFFYISSYRKVTILTYPQFQPYSAIRHVNSSGVCADSEGNVWVVGARYLYKYAHGGTKPIAKLDADYKPLLDGCSVDRTTGNLAVVVYHAGIVIFPHAGGKGKKFYETPVQGEQCAYDDKGNLFVNDYYYFKVAELPNGSSQFETMTLDKSGLWGGGDIRWDGKYMAISTTIHPYRHVIYRFEVSGSRGKVVQAVHFKDQYEAWKFWIQGDTMIAPTPHGFPIALWSYPEGGNPYKKLHIPAGYDMTVSVAPSRSRIRK